MIKLIFDQLKSIHFHTALLEATGWDDNAAKVIMKKLEEYFNQAEVTSIDKVKNDLKNIFEENICKIVFDYIDYAAKRINDDKGFVGIEA